MSEPNENFQPPPPPSMPEAAPRAPRPTKLRIPAIALIVVGILLLVGGLLKFLSGGIGGGAALVALGVFLLGFSFIPLPVVENPEAPMSPLQKLTGIFFEPSRVFRNLRSHPHWVVAYVLIVLLSVVYSLAFTQRVTPERIVNHTFDKLAGTALSPPPEQIETMKASGIEEAKNNVNKVMKVATSFFGVFFLMSILAGIYLLGIVAFGGKINFWQSFATMMYASVPIVVVQKVLGLVLLYMKAPEDIHPILGQETLVQDNLGILFSPADHPVLFVLASAIGILSFYSLWLKATGLKNAGTKVSSGTAWGVAVTLWVVGTLLITGWTALFPGFIG